MWWKAIVSSLCPLTVPHPNVTLTYTLKCIHKFRPSRADWLLLLDGASCLQCCQGNSGRSGCGLKMRHMTILLKVRLVFKIWYCTTDFDSVSSMLQYVQVHYLLTFSVSAALPCSTLCSLSVHQPPLMQSLSEKLYFFVTKPSFCIRLVHPN